MKDLIKKILNESDDFGWMDDVNPISKNEIVDKLNSLTEFGLDKYGDGHDDGYKKRFEEGFEVSYHKAFEEGKAYQYDLDTEKFERSQSGFDPTEYDEEYSDY